MHRRAALVSYLLASAALVTSVRLDLFEGDTCKHVTGVAWTCRKFKDCTKAQEDLKEGRSPDTCNFNNEDFEAVVCCEPVQTSPRPNPALLNPGSQRKSTQMCKEYAKLVYYEIKSAMDDTVAEYLDTCALIEPLITNGTKAQPREFPHMALIGYGNNNYIQWRCGGSLISERWVLSAAHCTPTGENRPKRVRLGDYNVQSTTDDEENNARSVEFDIIEQIIHPQYDPVNQYNDIALYKLNRSVEFNEYVRPLCLHTEYQIPKKQGLITGWGRVEFGGRKSDFLQKGNVSFISRDQCSDMLKSVPTLKTEIHDNSMICAANFLSEVDTCQGDSGGPLQYPLTEPYCMYSQVGITSFGVKCATSYPAVYTRVSYFVPWIEKIVWP